MRLRNVKTGEPGIIELPEARWQLSGNRLIVRHPGPPGKFWPLAHSQGAKDEVLVLTPDGTDRFRYQRTFEGDSASTEPPQTGTMTRVKPAD